MPFTLPTPVVVDGVEYPYAGVSLITSPGFSETSVSARINLTLEPYRVDENGKIVRPTVLIEMTDSEGVTGLVRVVDSSKSITKSYANAYLATADNPNLAQALGVISTGIQGFIDSEF